TTTFGRNQIQVISGKRYRTRTIAHLRILYNTANRVNGGAKLQVYLENPSYTIRARMLLGDQLGAWTGWSIIDPVLEGTPEGWAPDPVTLREDVTGDSLPVYRLSVSDTATINGNRILDASGGTITGNLTVQGTIYGFLPSTAKTGVGNEYNILLYGNKRGLTISQTGTAKLNLDMLVDGRVNPTYSALGIPPDDPTVILIEGLPAVHTQTGGYIGWTSRYWYPSRYKIEGYNVASGANEWVTIFDQSETPVPTQELSLALNRINKAGTYTKLRFTIYDSTGPKDEHGNPRFGLSQLFFIHPEAARVNEYMDFL